MTWMAAVSFLLFMPALLLLALTLWDRAQVTPCPTRVRVTTSGRRESHVLRRQVC
jgi:hypothetical protein